METNQHIQTDNSMANTLTAILIFFVGIFKWASTLTAEDVYTWVFRALSLVSLALIIIINWPKAKAIIFKNKHKTE